MKNLLDLPPEASYQKKNGQAGVKVSQKDGVLTVDASCDSLQRQCWYYEKEMSTLRAESGKILIEEQKKSNSIAERYFFYGIFIGAVSVLSMFLLLIFKKKKNE